MQHWLRREPLPGATRFHKVRLWILRNLTMAVTMGLMSIALAMIVPLYVTTLEQKEKLVVQTGELTAERNEKEAVVQALNRQNAIERLQAAQESSTRLAAVSNSSRGALSKPISDALPWVARVLRDSNREFETLGQLQLSSLVNSSANLRLESVQSNSGAMTRWSSMSS